MKKTIGWFSGGVTSAVAVKLELLKGKDLRIIYFETGQHHPDHERFLADCENWYGQEIEVMQNEKYISPIDVAVKDGYVNDPSGARCTLVLKKHLRWRIEKEMEFKEQIFGFEYDVKQVNRAIRFTEQYPDAKAIYPLIDDGWDKKMCMDYLVSEKIELPVMYRLGYNNSNCIGCFKGGMGYFNKIRVDFPEIFKATAEMERVVGHSCIKGVFLDELEPERGRHKDISLPECGVVCPVEMDGLKTYDEDEAMKKYRETMAENNLGNHGRCEECNEYYCKKDCPKWRRENEHN